MLEKLNTMEDLNSLLLLDPHYHNEYKINLGLLPDVEFSDYYYDFNVIDMSLDGSKFIKIFKAQDPAVSDELSFDNVYCNDSEFTKDTFIQFDLKTENIDTSKIGLYQTGTQMTDLCSISSFNLKNKEWANIVIVKVSNKVMITVNGTMVYENDYLDGRKKYKLAIAVGTKRERIYIKNYQVIQIEGGELVKEGIERDPDTNEILDCSKTYGTATSECTTFNGKDLRHVHGTGYFSIGEDSINLYDDNVYLYKFYMNTSAGTTDLSKIKLNICESDRSPNRVYGYDYKEWKFSDLFDENQCATVYVMLYNKKIYIFDVEYGVRKIEEIPMADKLVRLFIEIDNTDLWIENFNVYKFPRNTNFIESMHPLNPNSCDIEKQTNNYNHYRIKVFNKLWTGEVKFDRISPYSEKPVFWTEVDNLNYNNEVYIIHVFYEGDDFDVILTLDNDYTGKRKSYEKPHEEVHKLKDLKIITELEKSYKYSYYNRPTIKIKCLDGTGLPIYQVNCINNEIGCNGKTDVNGEFSFIPKLLQPGTYYYNITLSKLGYETTYCKLKLVVTKEPPEITIEEEQAYWGGYCTDTFYINVEGGNQENLKAKITCNDSVINSSVTKNLIYDNAKNKYYVRYEQSYRGKRLTTSTINVSLIGNNFLEGNNKTFVKTHKLKILNSWTQLRDEVDNERGVDIAGLEVGNHKVDGMIQVRRDFELIGITGKNKWTTLINNGSRNATPKYAFSIFPKDEKWITFKINNIKFFELNKCMFLNGYVNVNIDNCLFLNNSENLSQDLGLCVETNIGQTYINNNYGNVNITRSMFINNKGSSVATSYNTNINTCKFILTDWNYAQHPQAYGVEIYGQNTTIKDCDFILSMHGRSPLPNYEHSNFSHGSAPLRVGKQATINGLYGSSIARDNSGSLCVNGCTAYSYAKYKYDGINVTLSPVLGHERCAYKHIINGINWAWQNNTRVNSYYDNTNNRPNVIIPNSPDENMEINKFNARQKW